ncbi:hypothetical protein HAX54_016125 [Datura stramonium]|uniref:Uncharacterized protein n=1 Tax=Datura stramonium TaxID=4076 RepID=A0ABS8S0E1_DATST|nr:hypothetical protein [Datura stramonium]
MVFLGHPFEFFDCKSAEGSESPILEGTPVEFWDCKSVEGSESPNLVETPVEFWDYRSAEGSENRNFVETPVEFWDCESAKGSESPNLESTCYDSGSITAICDHYQYLRDKLGENSAETGSTRGIMKKKILEDFLKEFDVFENLTWGDTVEEKKIEPKGTKVDKAKDWKRTLACKFYEERHNASDSTTGEGMDLLWEKYEMDSIMKNVKTDNNNNSNTKKKMKRKGELKSYVKEEKINEHIEQLCCLQALKFSAGKMNLGMGRANLVRISKAIKGFKWIQHVSKNNKKVHCGDRF